MNWKKRSGICFSRVKLLFNDEVYAINMRQKTSLQVALDHLHQVTQSIEDDMPEDFLFH